MVCRGIYESSLALLGETPSGEHSGDYEERAPYLLAALCHLLADRDVIYRKECSLGSQRVLPEIKLQLYDTFPLCDAFAPAAAYYLASMLIFDIDSERSDSLFEKYESSVTELLSGLPFKSIKTIDKYPV